MNWVSIAPLTRWSLPLVAAGCLWQSSSTTVPVSAQSQRQSQFSIRDVTLTVKDVTNVYGSGFRPFMNGIESNKDLASVGKSAGASPAASGISTRGRVTGFISIWFRSNKSNAITVLNGLNQYTNSDIPRAAFHSSTRQYKSIKGVKVHISSLNGVGDEAFLLTTTSGSSTSISAIYRRGRYLVNVTASSQHGRVALSGLTKLAAIEDQRIQSAG